jgi:hypothetical protein
VRNPFRGLLGAYVSYTNWDQFGGVHATQAAGEFEAYLGRWTLRGIVGAEFGNSASTYYTATGVIPPAVGIPGVINTTVFAQGYDVKTRFMDQVNLQYYLTDNWEAYVGHRYVGGRNALALGSEIGLPLGRGVMGTAFVEGRVGSNNFEGVWGGLRFYFGRKDKSLIRRHREDDPTSPWDTLFSIVNNLSQSTLQSAQALPALPAEVPTPSDIRLKRDIVLLAHLENGVGLYRYRYLWSDQLYVGVMAQEVAEIFPDAVVRGENGYLGVNYARLGLRLLTWDQWMAYPTSQCGLQTS